MKYLLISLSLLAWNLPAQTVGRSPAFIGAVHQRAVTSGGGGGGVAATDDFNRADAANLGGNWTADSSQIAIAGNTAVGDGIAYGKMAVRYTGTNTSSANQYVKVTFVSATISPGSYPHIFFRMTDASSACYSLEFQANEDIVVLNHNATPAGSTTEIVNTALTIVAGDIFGITCTGTGTSTEVRIWRNPTNLPTSASNWDGDTTPDVSFTTDPASAVNTGTQVGLGGYESATSNITFDNLFFGDVP